MIDNFISYRINIASLAALETEAQKLRSGQHSNIGIGNEVEQSVHKLIEGIKTKMIEFEKLHPGGKPKLKTTIENFSQYRIAVDSLEKYQAEFNTIAEKQKLTTINPEIINRYAYSVKAIIDEIKLNLKAFETNHE